MTGHILKELQHILLFYKRHLTVNLCELWLTVCTQVFVTEALGNLEITVETTHHQQLLQSLRRLRQCIELSGIHTRGYHEITGSLRCRTNQDWRLHLDEVLTVEEVTYENGHAVTQFEVLTDCSTTQIQITVFHTNIIAAVGIILDGERRCEALTQDIQFPDQDFNIARRHLGILALTFADLTFYLNTELTSQFVGTLTQCSIVSLIEHQLSQAITITEVDEGHATHFTASLYPSGQCDNAAGIRES